MKIALPYHLGNGNRGCEGIARGIATILKLDKSKLILYDITENDYESDRRAGLDEVGELRQKGSMPFELVRLFCRIIRRLGFSCFYNQWMSSFYLRDLGQGDIVFITGGDIYCYEGAYVLPNLIAKKAKKKGVKAVLFGVSMEKKFLDEKVVAGLRNYDLITTRETISANTMTDLGLKNYLYPDPAFLLKPVECLLLDYFKKEVVGINFSPFTDTDGLFEENMNMLIEYVLSQGMEVCFIPHVFWKEQDDRKSLSKYTERYGNRVHVLDSEKMSYLQIRYAVSKCKYFIGGRTHSVISAYSTHVPCIALGYSVKARGIAGDIGLPEYTVVDSKKLKGNSDILDAFIKMEQNYKDIMRIYEGMDDYIKKTDGLRELVLE
jgi:polysaccharide pyruvyl transferase WcaK-like protein